MKNTYPTDRYTVESVAPLLPGGTTPLTPGSGWDGRTPTSQRRAMKEKQKTVYYCDFCKKYRLTRNSMALHELHCTLNPDRICRVLGCTGNCPWCDFSRLRIKEDPKLILFGSAEEKMKDWWAKQEDDAIEQEVYTERPLYMQFYT